MGIAQDTAGWMPPPWRNCACGRGQAYRAGGGGIERIERLNPELNASSRPCTNCPRGRSGSYRKARSPGCPFSSRTSCAYSGVRMCWGYGVARDCVPAFDSELVVRQKRAGLVILGKTNTPSSASCHYRASFFGPSRNPGIPGRTTGGSSGARRRRSLRHGPMAHANDGGGSIRIPVLLRALRPQPRGRATPLDLRWATP